MDSAREAVAWLEQHATYTRTGHHSARTGEWRYGGGLAASLFLHHLSRDGDPQLHVHVAIWNRVQRADGADAKWRTLDSRSLHNQRLGVAPVADRILETTPAAPKPMRGAPSPGRPVRPSPPRRSGSPPGKPRPHGAKCTRCRGCTSRSPRSPPGTPGVHRPCWMTRPSVPPRGSRWPRCKTSCGVVDGSAPVRGAPRAAGPGGEHRRPGGGRRGRQTGRRRPVRHRGRPGHRSGPRRRDRARRPGLRRRQHLPAAKRGAVLQPGSPRCGGADPRGRETGPAAPRGGRAGPGCRRAHRTERRAARCRRHDAHRNRSYSRAGRPGRRGQEPHHGRVRPAVDHLHRPPCHRPDHLDQRRPGPSPQGPGRELQHRRVPRQGRRLRRTAPTRAPAPGRRARPGRSQPAVYR